MAYTEEQRIEFLTLAQEVGIGRAMRELEYPGSYQTALNWAKNHGVTVNVDPVMQHVKAFDDLYKTEHLLAISKEGLQRIWQELTESKVLSPDDQKKLSEAFQKYSNTWLVLNGKANDIKETHTREGIDVDLLRLFADEEARNRGKVDSVES